MTRLRSTLRFISATTLGLALLSGCQSESFDDSDSITAAVEAACDDTAPPARRPPPAPDSLIHIALQSLDLGAVQRQAIQGILEELKSPRDALGAARQAFHQQLAEGVRASAIDQSSFDDAVMAIETHATLYSAEVAVAIKRLHEVLAPEQRSALLEQLKELAPPPPPPEGEAAPPPPPDGEAAPEGAPPRPEGELDSKPPPPPGAKLVTALELSDAQHEALRQAHEEAGLGRPLGDRCQRVDDGRKQEKEAFLAAFASDTLDPSLIPGERFGEHARHQASRLATLAQLLVPILDESQRERLAELLESPPPPPEGRAEGPSQP